VVIRTGIAVTMIVACGLYTRGATGPEHPAPRTALARLPLNIEQWRGVDARTLEDDVLTELGVDDYINRHYARAGDAPVSAYVGYYASQRQGDTIHSPQNCLPGAGWRPVHTEQVGIALDGRTGTVNRILIQKGLERQAVLYWYQGRGRVIASEYVNKGWLMLDAARFGRTDGGLVRLIMPVKTDPDGAFTTLTAFGRSLMPRLWSYLP